jgi:hypothetical protein
VIDSGHGGADDLKPPRLPGRRRAHIAVSEPAPSAGRGSNGRSLRTQSGSAPPADAQMPTPASVAAFHTLAFLTIEGVAASFSIRYARGDERRFT